ncbi:MAG: hypothetical protein H7Y37_06405 [Anaerolineae bacterium]|nr:hypothetical protein [Gloeobacterales cyanobacterium ES-bin-313]
MDKLRWIGTVIVGAVTALLMAFFWPFLCYQMRTFIGINGSATWLKQFTAIGLVGVGISLFLCLVWYVLGEFVFKESATGLWWVFLLITLIAAIVPAFWPGAFPVRVSNLWVVSLFYFINNTVIGYWLSTFFFYPSTQLLVPLGADGFYTKSKR